MENMPELRLIEVSGSHYEMGYQLGREAKEEVRSMIEDYKKIFRQYSGLDWKESIEVSKKYLEFSENYVPELVDELRGIAEGAGASFEDVFALNCGEELMYDTPKMAKGKNSQAMKCTSIVVSNGDKVLMGQNEDWIKADEKRQYIVHAKPDDGPEFLALSYGCLLPNIGLNSRGVGHCATSVNPNDIKVGVPRILVTRKILSAGSIEEAVKYATLPQRTAGYGHLLSDSTGRICEVEASQSDFELTELKGCTARTNHYRSDKMKNYEQGEPDTDSLKRYERASELVEKAYNTCSFENFTSILKDHGDGEYPICDHSREEFRSKTISSIVMDLKNLTLYAAQGNPCENAYKKFELGKLATGTEK